jgi:hypothetical protein
LGALGFGEESMGVPLLSAPSGGISPCIRDHKSRQAIRIKELGAALAAAGLFSVAEQARALGLSRSTAWAVLKANHKASGLAAGTINQMLSSPALPPRARVTILIYVEEKLAGLYGHNKTQLRRFAAGFDPCNRGHSLFAGNVLVATLAWIIVRLVH